MTAVVRSIDGKRSSRELQRLTSLQARCARMGFDLQPLSGKSLIVQRWGLWRVLDDVEAAERWFNAVRRAR